MLDVLGRIVLAVPRLSSAALGPICGGGWSRGRRDYGRSYRVAHLPEPGGRYFAMTRSSARATTSWLGSAAGADRSWSRALIGDPHDAGMTTSHVPHPFNFPFPSRRRQRLLRLFAAGEALSAAAAGRTPLPLWGPNIQPCRLTRRNARVQAAASFIHADRVRRGLRVVIPPRTPPVTPRGDRELRPVALVGRPLATRQRHQQTRPIRPPLPPTGPRISGQL